LYSENKQLNEANEFTSYDETKLVSTLVNEILVFFKFSY